MRGLTVANCAYVRPSFAGTSPRRLLVTASAPATSLWNTAWPSEPVVRSRVRLFFARLSPWKNTLFAVSGRSSCQ